MEVYAFLKFAYSLTDSLKVYIILEIIELKFYGAAELTSLCVSAAILDEQQVKICYA